MKNSLNRNAKDKVFKNLLMNKERLAQFYYDLTGRKVDPDDIEYDSIATSIVKGKEEDVAFQIGDRYIILLEAQSTWSDSEVIRFTCYMFLLFLRFVENHTQEIFEKNEKIVPPAIEAYVIFTGTRKLPEKASLDEMLPKDLSSMINAEMKIITAENATGMVKEYIDFSRLETKYYTENKRSEKDVLEMIDYCIKNNILKNYMFEHRNEVATLIDSYFTEEQRIKNIVNRARDEERKKAQEAEKKLKAEIKLLKAESKKKEESILAENKKKEESILAERTELINRLSDKLKLSPEEIVDMTGYPVETVNKVLNKK